MLSHSGEQRGVTLDALFARHGDRALYRLRDIVGVVGIDDQRLLKILGRAGKSRQHQNARVVVVLGRHIFLGDEIHAVAQWRDETDLTARYKRRQNVARNVSVDITHGRPVEVAELPIDLPDSAFEFMPNVGVGLHLLARWRGDLHQGRRLAISRIRVRANA